MRTLNASAAFSFVPPPTPPLSKDHLHRGHAYNLSVVCHFSHLHSHSLLSPCCLLSSWFWKQSFRQVVWLGERSRRINFWCHCREFDELADRLCVGPGHKPLSCVVCSTCTSKRDVVLGWWLQNAQNIAVPVRRLAHVGRPVKYIMNCT